MKYSKIPITKLLYLCHHSLSDIIWVNLKIRVDIYNKVEWKVVLFIIIIIQFIILLSYLVFL